MSSVKAAWSSSAQVEPEAFELPAEQQGGALGKAWTSGTLEFQGSWVFSEKDSP